MEDEIVEPSVFLVNSLRSIGYSFPAAMADLVDNSIAAGAKKISIFADVVNGKSISILDDGRGMTVDQVREALRFAGTANLERSETDLGKFGLGLKTASLSQAKRLSVISKTKSGVAARRWDLDYVVSRGKWALQTLDQDAIDSSAQVSELENSSTGTLVEWQELDLLLGDSESPGPYLAGRLVELRHELGLIFHRFISRKKDRIRIEINGLEILPIDPFLSNLTQTQQEMTEPIQIGGSIVQITPYTLPHPRTLTAEQRRRADLNDDLRDSQGFYVYRNERLISRGHWFGVTARSELTKLTRVQVDVPPALDSLWQLDVKKSRTDPPASFKQKLKDAIEPLLSRSRTVFTYRGRRENESNFLHVWTRIKDEKGFRYEINLSHPVIGKFMNGLPDDKDREVARLMELIAETYPFDDAYQLMAAGNSPEEIPTPELRARLHELKLSLAGLNFGKQDVQRLLSQTEPFKRMNAQDFNDLFETEWEEE
jgi:hypothetical protein